MKAPLPRPAAQGAFRLVCLLLLIGAAQSAGHAATRVSIRDGRWFLNNLITHPRSPAEGRLMNVRMVNSTFEDRDRADFDPVANTERFLAQIPAYAAQGVRAFTLNLQGGMPGYEGARNSAFDPDGSLRPDYLERVRRVIEACDRAGVAVILGCFYQRQDQVLRDEAAVRAALVNTVRWIGAAGFQNVVLEVANEFDHGGFDHRLIRTVAGQIELIQLARQTLPGLLVSTSGLGHGRYPESLAEAADFLLIHFNGTPVKDIPARIAALASFGKPVVCNEDDKLGEEAAAAARATVESGGSWGFMHKTRNQYQPFDFLGPADAPVVYAALRELTSPARTTVRARGPLRVHPHNPRYLADDLGRAVLLTGSHTWNNLQDMRSPDGGAPFDYPAWLRFLRAHDHNFMRLWRWELLAWDTAANRQETPLVLRATPHPWPRTGPGTALDGQPRFDLARFNDAYFERLRERVALAGESGVYTAVMLFEGWGMQFVENAWSAHPFHPANNINGVDGDRDGDGRGLEIHESGDPIVLALQEAYVRRVLDTVNDLDNVLFEISNENHPASTDWQYHFIRFIHEYERTLPKQHLVGMTFQYKGGRNETLFESPADWISPNPAAPDGFSHRDNPPPANGSKVVISDTDHLWGIGGNVAWVWKTFLRGAHPVFMDPYNGAVLRRGNDDQWEPVRRAMGAVARLASSLDLASMRPCPDLAPAEFCLADEAGTRLAWVPSGKALHLEPPPSGRGVEVRWFHPETADPESPAATALVPPGPTVHRAPFDGDAIVLIRPR